MANFTIYRDSWRRGGDGIELLELGSTSLYNATNNLMCCLGQCAFEAGVKLDALEGIGEPNDVSFDDYPVLIGSGLLNDDEGYWRQSAFSKQAIPINDDEQITDRHREEKLIELGSRYGHTITFVEGIAPWFISEEAANV